MKKSNSFTCKRFGLAIGLLVAAQTVGAAPADDPIGPDGTRLLLFGKNTMNGVLPPPIGLVKAVFYRDPASDNNKPIYLYVQDRLHASLLQGGYHEVIGCSPGLYRFAVSVKPLTTRELDMRDQQQVHSLGAATQMIPTDLKIDSPVAYFSISTSTDGQTVMVKTEKTGPSAERRSGLRKLNAVVRSKVIETASCTFQEN